MNTLALLKELSKLDIMALVRLHLRLLFQKYSAGGFNLGRSVRSIFLETYLSLVKSPEMAEPADDYDLDILNAGLGLRPNVDDHPVTDSLTSETVETLDAEQLALLCLSALWLWHDRQADEHLFNIGAYSDKTWVNNLYNKLPCPSIPRDTDLGILSGHVSSRLSTLLNERYDEEFPVEMTD